MKQNRRNMVILFFTLVVIMLGFGMINPPCPFLHRQIRRQRQ